MWTVRAVRGHLLFLSRPRRPLLYGITARYSTGSIRASPSPTLTTVLAEIDRAKTLPPEEAAPLLAASGSALKELCGNGEGQACTRLGRWHVFGVGDCPIDFAIAWALLLKGWRSAGEAEAAHWLGWICANDKEASAGGQGIPSPQL